MNETERIILPANDLSRSVESPPTIKLPTLPLGWQLGDVSTAMAGEGEKLPWVIENLLLADSATLISAHLHSMKSLAWLAACMEAAAKQKVWGHFDAPLVKKSLFIETEDPL